MLHLILILLPALCQSNVDVEQVSRPFAVASGVDLALVRAAHGALLARERLYFRCSGRYTRDVRQGEQQESTVVDFAVCFPNASRRSLGELKNETGTPAALDNAEFLAGRDYLRVDYAAKKEQLDLFRGTFPLAYGSELSLLSVMLSYGGRSLSECLRLGRVEHCAAEGEQIKLIVSFPRNPKRRLLLQLDPRLDLLPVEIEVSYRSSESEPFAPVYRVVTDEHRRVEGWFVPWRLNATWQRPARSSQAPEVYRTESIQLESIEFAGARPPDQPPGHRFVRGDGITGVHLPAAEYFDDRSSLLAVRAREALRMVEALHHERPGHAETDRTAGGGLSWASAESLPFRAVLLTVGALSLAVWILGSIGWERCVRFRNVALGVSAVAIVAAAIVHLGSSTHLRQTWLERIQADRPYEMKWSGKFCGPETAYLVGQLLGDPRTYRECFDAVPLDPQRGASLRALEIGLLNLGVSAKARFAERTEALPSVCVLHLAEEHFVVAMPVDDERLVVLDPVQSPLIIDRSELERFLSGWLIEIT